MFAEVTLTGWPLVTAIGIGAVCFVSLWIGWPNFITINKHYHCDKCETEEDDE